MLDWFLKVKKKYFEQKKVSRRLEDTVEQTSVNAAVADAVSSMIPSMSDTINSEMLQGIKMSLFVYIYIYHGIKANFGTHIIW